MRNKNTWVGLFTLALICSSAHAAAKSSGGSSPAGGGFGLGIIIGDPTAITAKQYLGHDRAFDLGFGYDWGHSVLFYADYLFHFPGAFTTSSSWVNSLSPYVGIGPEMEFVDSSHPRTVNGNRYTTSLNARIPLGIAWAIPSSPIELFGEVAPVVVLIPGLGTK